MTRIFALILLLCAATLAKAQDVITLRNGEEIPCKVAEITPEMVKYKQLSNLEGPLISIYKKDVFMIKYENGSKEVFGDGAQPSNAGSNNTGNPPIDAKPNAGDEPVTVTYSRLGGSGPRDHELHNLVKFGITNFINGDFPFYYERRLGDHISVEGSVGITHRDLLYDGVILNLAPEYIGREPRFGYSARLGLHLYPGSYSTALEDWYFGPEIHVRQHNSTLATCGGIAPANPAKEYRRLIDFRIVGGNVIHIGDQVIAEWYGAVGVRSRDQFRAECDYTGPVLITRAPTHEVDMVPVFTAGLKIGFGW